MRGPTRVPQLGRPLIKDNPELQRVIDALIETMEVREGRRGQALDKGVTFRDLVDGGLADWKAGGGIRPPGDGDGGGGGGGGDPGGVDDLPDMGTVVPALECLQVTGSLGVIFLTWCGLEGQYRDYSHVNVYRATTNDLGAALKIGVGEASMYVDADVTPNQQYCYWIRAETTAAFEGPVNATAGTCATAMSDPAYLIALLENQIRESELFATLGARIDLIDGPDHLTGTVAQRVLAEAQAREAALVAEAAARDAAIASAVSFMETYADSSSAAAVKLDQLVAAFGGNVATALSFIVAEVDANSAVATAYSDLRARFDARSSARPNLLPNGSFLNGLAGWGPSPGALDDFAVVSDPRWGKVLRAAPKVSPHPVAPNAIPNGVASVYHDYFPAVAGEWYTIHGDLAVTASAGFVYLDLVFYSDTEALLDGPQNAQAASFPFSDDVRTYLEDGTPVLSTREKVAVEVQAPVGTTRARARLVWDGIQSCSHLGVRQLKVERGRLPYSSMSYEAASEAAIVRQDEAVATETSARAAAFTQVNAEIDGLQANVVTLDQAIVNESGARATAINQVWVDVDGNTAAIETKAETSVVTNLQGEVVSIKAQWTVKTDVNGLVAGIGLMNDGMTSALGVRADTFWVAGPGTPGAATAPAANVPFIVKTTNTTVDGVNFPPGVYMKSATIESAGIKHAHIENGFLTNLTARAGKLQWVQITRGAINQAYISGDIQSGSVNTADPENWIWNTSYVPSSQGWIIRNTGTVEFNNGTFRGHVQMSSGSIDSAVVIGTTMTGSELEWYTSENRAAVKTATNANFDFWTVGWHSLSGTWAVVATTGSVTGKVLRRTYSGGASSAALWNVTRFPVGAGQRMTVSGWVRSSGGHDHIGWRVGWLDINGTLFAHSDATTTASGLGLKYVTKTGPAPAGARYAVLQPVVYAQTSGYVDWLDGDLAVGDQRAGELTEHWVRPGFTTIKGDVITTGTAYVDTLEIKLQAVTFASALSVGTEVVLGSWKDLRTFNFPTSGTGKVAVNAIVRGGGTKPGAIEHDVRFRILVGGETSGEFAVTSPVVTQSHEGDFTTSHNLNMIIPIGYVTVGVPALSTGTVIKVQATGDTYAKGLCMYMHMQEVKR